jgi:PPOX class probable F420-dependent enzyme
VGTQLDAWSRKLLERPRMFATLATIDPDGSPLLAVVWYALRADDILVNSRVGRRWPTNLLRDPRYSLMVEDGYDWVSIAGAAEALPDRAAAQEDIAAMARAYHEPAHAERVIREQFRRQERISFLLRVERVGTHRDSP